MTKKDFIQLAAIAGLIHDRAIRLVVTEAMINLFKHDNPRFHAERFIDAVEAAALSQGTQRTRHSVRTTEQKDQA